MKKHLKVSYYFSAVHQLWISEVAGVAVATEDGIKEEIELYLEMNEI